MPSPIIVPFSKSSQPFCKGDKTLQYYSMPPWCASISLIFCHQLTFSWNSGQRGLFPLPVRNKEKSGIPPASAGSDRLRGYNRSMDETGGRMPVIYLDVLVVLNWFIDFLLLSSTSRILRLPFKRWRLVLGALLGGISSCLIFLPAMPFLPVHAGQAGGGQPDRSGVLPLARYPSLRGNRCWFSWSFLPPLPESRQLYGFCRSGGFPGGKRVVYFDVPRCCWWV